MRILIVTGIFPPDIGGPATYVPLIGSFLANSGHEITVLTLSERDARDDSYPFSVIRVPRLRNKLVRFPQTVSAIVRFGRRADLVYVNGLALESAIANLLIRRPLVLKVVGDWAWERATLRNRTELDFIQFQRTQVTLGARFLKGLRNWWSKAADRIIVPSRFLANCVEQWGVPESRIEVVYNSLESPQAIQSKPIPLPTGKNLVTVGRLVPWKRIDGILRCLKDLEEGVGLVVIGSGPEENALKELTRELGVERRVFFAGSRTRQETLALMSSCQAFVLNSSYEGLPHVVLEAMSLGIPVISSSAGGVAEVIEDRRNGLLVPLDGTGFLHDAIYNVLNNEILSRKLVANARNDLERFKVQSMYDFTEKVLSEAVH